MIGLLQRVREARVDVSGACVAKINVGLLVLVGIQPEDDTVKRQRLLERLLGYRVFEDVTRLMNRSLRDLGPDRGGLLLVPQFTLAADTRRGMRASFTSAAAPEQARLHFEALVCEAAVAWPGSCAGIFGANMQVSLVNDGPVTFWLQT
ncbi:MAG: D-tyrosyl-tRNA(Tyr) deacylase [Xanthomonadaceae bacterium]|nr:D-tyrosyl-tRNA(Tyr) deacylase [Xanthomonadaceae bacterium]